MSVNKKYFAIFAPGRFTGIVDDQEKLWDYTRKVSGYTSKTFTDLGEAIDFMQERTDDFTVDVSDKEIPLIFVVTKGFETGVFKVFREFARAIKDHPNPNYKRFHTLKEAITYYEKHCKNNNIVNKSTAIKEIRKKDKGFFKVILNTLKTNGGYIYTITYETEKFNRFKDTGFIEKDYEGSVLELLEKIILNASLNGYKEITLSHNIDVQTYSKIRKENRKSFKEDINPFVKLDKYDSILGITYKRLKETSMDYKKGQKLCTAFLSILEKEGIND